MESCVFGVQIDAAVAAASPSPVNQAEVVRHLCLPNIPGKVTHSLLSSLWLPTHMCLVCPSGWHSIFHCTLSLAGVLNLLGRNKERKGSARPRDHSCQIGLLTSSGFNVHFLWLNYHCPIPFSWAECLPHVSYCPLIKVGETLSASFGESPQSSHHRPEHAADWNT